MYLNTKFISKKGLILKDIINLQLIHQNKTEDMSTLIELEIHPRDLNIYLEDGYIHYVKAKKANQNPLELLRLTDRGKKTLDNAQTPLVTEDSLKIFEWVRSIYVNSGKEIGNQKKCKIYIEEFSKESGIYQNELALLIKTFLDDEKEFEFSQKMEFLFFKGSSLYSTRFDINQSRLFQYYEKKKQYFDERFAKLK